MPATTADSSIAGKTGSIGVKTAWIGAKIGAIGAKIAVIGVARSMFCRRWAILFWIDSAQPPRVRARQRGWGLSWYLATSRSPLMLRKFPSWQANS